MKVAQACPTNTGDSDILKSLLNPLSPQTLAMLIAWAAIFAAAGVVSAARRHDPGLKGAIRMTLLANGFFYGFIVARLVIGRIYNTPPFAAGYMFNALSVLYIYLLYLVAHYLPLVMPRARLYETEYGFIFDSLFVLIASTLFAMGFDESIDVVLSGAAYMICAFLIMIAFDTVIITPATRYSLALAIVAQTFDSAPPPKNNWRMVLKALWNEVKRTRGLNRDDALDQIRALATDEDDYYGRESQQQTSKSFTIIITLLLLTWPIVMYAIYRMLAARIIA